MILGEGDEIVATLVCGDNAFHADPEANLAAAVAAVAECRPDLFIAGPAFNAGRYGLACGAVCAAVTEQLGHPRDHRPLSRGARGRRLPRPDRDGPDRRLGGRHEGRLGRDRSGRVAACAGRGLLPADEDGRIPMGYRANWPTDVPVSQRAADDAAGQAGR